MVSKDTIKQLTDRVAEQLEGAKHPIVIMEGCLLYRKRFGGD